MSADTELPISIFLRQTNQDGQYLRQAFRGILTRTPQSTESHWRKVRTSVKQGHKDLSSQNCHSKILFYKNPFFDTSLDEDFSQGFEVPWSMDDYGFYSLSTRDEKSICAFQTRGRHQNSQVMCLDFGFDFDVNPCVYIGSEAGTDDKFRPPPQEDTEFNQALLRYIFVIREAKNNRNRWFLKGHRSRGPLVWFPDLNAIINIQKKSFMSGMCWTVDIQNADLARSELFSFDDGQLPMTDRLLPLDEDDHRVNDSCPIYSHILNEPIITQCKHTFCQSCFRWTDVSIDSTHIRCTPLNADENLFPWEISIICPVCGVHTAASCDTNR